MRLSFCGTPGFAIPQLEALLSDPYFEVVQVVTQPDRPAGRGQKVQPCALKVFAESKKLPVISPANINSRDVIEHLENLNLDAIVIVAFGQILRKDFLALCPGKCVNLHGSLLPRWRGAAPIQRSLMEGDRRSGVSLQVVVPKLDAGPIIGEKMVEVSPEMNALELHDLLAEKGKDLFLNDFKKFLLGLVIPQPQDDSQVTVAPKILKEETEIVWRHTAVTLHNRVRGLYMGPQTWTKLQGKTYKIHRTQVTAKSGRPGEVLEVHPDFFVVGTGRDSLEIWEIQPESKKKMLAAEFLRGFPLKKGDTFG